MLGPKNEYNSKTNKVIELNTIQIISFIITLSKNYLLYIQYIVDFLYLINKL